MTRDELPQYSFQVLEPFFQAEGYQLIDYDHQFRKEGERNWRNVIFSFSPYEDLSIVECTFGVRIDLVEQMIGPFVFGMRGLQSESNTAITNLSKYKEEKTLRFKVKDEADVYRMAAHIKDFFRKEGFEFLESLTLISQLDRYFNREPNKVSLLAFSEPLRCFRSMAVASLNQNPQLSSLSKQYAQRLALYGAPHPIRDRFKEFSRQLLAATLN